ALGVEPATHYPKVSDHIPEIIKMVQGLIEKGYAYQIDGDVYFAVDAYPEYGKLSARPLDEMLSGARVEADERKRNPMDFALWKRAKAGEPSWDSPWGPGRPGWHIECSAMAVKYLGAAFDIHGGGVDLVFPHHENEIAQAVCAGYPFARYWLHNAWVTLAGEKMSKSLGNTALVTDVAKRYRPVEIRYYLAAPHYRSTIE